MSDDKTLTLEMPATQAAAQAIANIATAERGYPCRVVFVGPDGTPGAALGVPVWMRDERDAG